ELQSGYGMGDQDDENKYELKALGPGEEENKQALALRSKEAIEREKEDERMKNLFRDPQAMQLALDVGSNASKNALMTGKTKVEINEYPSNARSWVIRKDYLNSISDMCKCTVTVRGKYVEFGKKPPNGEKKIHLYIQAASHQEVMSAYKEIKQFLDESALQYY